MSQASERPGPPPAFQEKRAYQLRRLMDAARLLPVLALFLWLVPLFWPQAGEGRVSSSTALVFIFVVWGTVILVTWGVSFALGRSVDENAGREE